MSNVNMKKLAEQSEELRSLIRSIDGVLDDPNPISDLRWDFERKVSDLTPEVMKVAKAAVATRRRPQELIMGAAVAAGVLAVGWTTAAAIDATRNGIAKAKARKKQKSCYEQLISKQNMIIQAQQQVNEELSAAIEQLSSNEAVYRQKVQELQKKQAELSSLLLRINTLRTAVEN